MNQTLVLQRVNWRKRLLKASKEVGRQMTALTLVSILGEVVIRHFMRILLDLEKQPNLVSE